MKKWAKAFGIESAPVLSGSRNIISKDPDIGWQINAWPQFHIVDKNMVLVRSFTGFSPGLIESIVKNNIESDTGNP